jgi:hypothetical protein
MLNKAELSLIQELLKLASEQFGNHGCNDYQIKNTPDNKTLLCKLIEWNDDPLQIKEDLPEVLSSKKKVLNTQDFSLMDYLAHRCKEELEN